MPHPSLTDEITGMIDDLLSVAYESGEAFATGQKLWQQDCDAKEAVQKAAIRSRLTELEQELEGYRAQEVGPLFVGCDPTEFWTMTEASRPDAYVVRIDTSVPPECSPRHASLDEAFACEVCNNPARVAAIYAKLPPGWDKLPDTPEQWPTPLLEIANENLRAWMERHPNPAAEVALPTAHSATSGVPCSSEYLSAQTGYDDEDGG